MNEDIVCLLQDLGTELSVDIIAQFIIRNPEVEDLIAAKMGSLLSVDQPAIAANQAAQTSTNAMSIPDVSTLAFSGLGDGNHKMIFVVNMGLNMGRGKQCAQVAHAALGLYLQIQQSNNSEHQSKILQWLIMGQKKIVVKGNNLQHLESIRQCARASGNLPTLLVSDAGCTQIAPGSKTVLAIFGSHEELEPVTGSLRLL